MWVRGMLSVPCRPRPPITYTHPSGNTTMAWALRGGVIRLVAVQVITAPLSARAPARTSRLTSLRLLCNPPLVSSRPL
jgi:hypothetical protein